MSSKKIHTAIYVMRYGQEYCEYASFAVLPTAKILKKLHELSHQSLTKSYWLEQEIVTQNMLPIGMIVPIKEKAIYRIEKGCDIIDYLGCINERSNDEIIQMVGKLSNMLLAKVYKFVKLYREWNEQYEYLLNQLVYELEGCSYNRLNNLEAYNFSDDSHLKIGPKCGSQ